MDEDDAMCAVVYGRLVLHWCIERYGWVLCLLVLMPWLCCADHDHADLDQTGIIWVLTFMPVVRLMKSLWCCCERFTPRCQTMCQGFRLVSEPDSWYEIDIEYDMLHLCSDVELASESVLNVMCFITGWDLALCQCLSETLWVRIKSIAVRKGWY